MEETKPQTPEELEALKKEMFAKDPSRFVYLGDLIVALLRTENGPALYCSPRSRMEAIMAKGEMDIALTKAILKNDAPAPKESGGIISAARNRLFRGKN